MTLDKRRVNQVSNRILVVALLYLYLYNPIPKWPGVGFVALLMLVALAYGALHYKTVLGYLKYYRAELLLSLFMIVYVPAICLVNGHAWMPVAKDLVLWLWCVTLVPIFLLEAVLSKYKSIRILDLLLDVGVVAASITLLAVLVPSFNTFLRGIQSFQEYAGVSDMVETQSGYRFFGLASNLVSGYGFVQGILASLCLLKIARKRLIRIRENRFVKVNREGWFYVFAFFALLLSVVVNARTGLFPVILTALFLLLRSLRKRDVRTFVKIGIGVAAVAVAFVVLLKVFPEIAAFALDFFLQISGFLGDSGIGSSAYGTMLKFPDTLTGIVFGEGRSIFLEEMGYRSDIAYVNQLFMGGLVFVAALLVYEFIVYRKICKRSGTFLFPTVCFLSLLIFNYKGTAFYATNAVVKFWMLYYFALVYNKRHRDRPIPLSNDPALTTV